MFCATKANAKYLDLLTRKAAFSAENLLHRSVSLSTSVLKALFSSVSAFTFSVNSSHSAWPKQIKRRKRLVCKTICRVTCIQIKKQWNYPTKKITCLRILDRRADSLFASFLFCLLISFSSCQIHTMLVISEQAYDMKIQRLGQFIENKKVLRLAMIDICCTHLERKLASSWTIKKIHSILFYPEI